MLCQCAEEVGFDWSVQAGDITTANKHLSRLVSLDEESHLIRYAMQPAKQLAKQPACTCTHESGTPSSKCIILHVYTGPA